MLVRPCWRPHSIEEAYRLVEEHPWALVINNGDDGPWATNLPLLLDRRRGARGTLVGHLARANPHAAVLFSSPAPTLALFQGPATYVTPSWYPNRDMPGTYYYTVVQCSCRVHPHATAELEASLEWLNDRMEGQIADGWSLDEIPRSEIERRLPAIVGFELEIERLEAKFKLGQDEPLGDALAVADRLAASTDPSRRALAAAIRRENAGRPEEGAAPGPDRRSEERTP